MDHRIPGANQIKAWKDELPRRLEELSRLRRASQGVENRIRDAHPDMWCVTPILLVRQRMELAKQIDEERASVAELRSRLVRSWRGRAGEAATTVPEV